MRRILVVDDDPAMVRTLCDILKLRGWESRGVHSGSEAVAVACADRYPVVLMDIMMPGMDGVAALRAMKQCDPSLQVVLMTAHTAADRLAEAEREGAAGVMTKPIDFPSLLAMLN
ncbi:MAG TPA: response regulator [Gemmatimonadales bacterium]|jgi:CheY-like chemotaxis protein